MFTPDVVHAFNAGEPVVVPAGQSFYTKEGMAIASLQLTSSVDASCVLGYKT
jgi:hypothetical protein